MPLNAQGQRPPNMEMIARRVGMTKSTVSLALQDSPRLKQETKERIKAVAAEMGYVKNPVMAHLMKELRRAHPRGFQQTIALLSAHPEMPRMAKHYGQAAILNGCREQAAAHGYEVDEFWLHERGLTAPRLLKILRARGIRGAILAGLANQRELLATLQPLLAEMACVTTGVRTDDPALPFAHVDHHLLMHDLMTELHALGYRRPGLVLVHSVNWLVNERYAAAMAFAQQALEPENRIPMLQIEGTRKTAPPEFSHWLRRQRPDVVITYWLRVRGWLGEMNVAIPGETGLVLLDRFLGAEGCAHMDQHNNITGEAAFDLLVTMLHNNQTGLGSRPLGVIHHATWVPGETVRPQ